MLRPSPKHGTLRLPTGDEDSSYVNIDLAKCSVNPYSAGVP